MEVARLGMRELAHPSDMQAPEAAVAILRTRDPDSTILLMRRAEREDDSWSGHWSLPGGHRDESDIDLLETAVREVHEECGIRLLREQMSAALPPAIARRRTGPFVTVAPFVFDVANALPTVLDVREAAAAAWIPQRTLLDRNQHSLLRIHGMPPQMWFPAIVLPGAPLWGFTYRLLTDWLGISSRNCPSAGFDAARAILDFLVSRGLPLRSAWRSTEPQGGDELPPLHIAQVSASIPAEAVIEHFSAPGSYVERVNAIEVGPEYVQVHGLAFEQYLIQAMTE